MSPDLLILQEAFVVAINSARKTSAIGKKFEGEKRYRQADVLLEE